jgi:predicted MPP superfamily phosphohydrolase
VELRRRFLPRNPVHNALVVTGWVSPVPWPLLLVLALLPAALTAQGFARPWVAAAVLAGATVTDAALLWALPRLNRSHGPLQGPLTLFTLGRHALALPLMALAGVAGLWALGGLQLALTLLSLWGHLVAPFRIRVETVRLPVHSAAPPREPASASPPAEPPPASAFRPVRLAVTVQGSRRTENSTIGNKAGFPAAARSAMIGGEPRKTALLRVEGGWDIPPEQRVRLVFLSDLHVERFGPRERRALALVDELDPDLVLFGGDVLNLSYVEDPRAQADAVRFFTHLAHRHPLVSVLGNPTVEDRVVVKRLWRAVGVTPLDAAVSRHTVRGLELAIFGLPATESVDEDAARLEALLREHDPRLPPGAVRILLYHRPDLAGRTPGIDLYLCGHTHGGQIRLPFIGPLVTASDAPRRLAAGTHRVGDTWLHTGRGLGLEGLGAPRLRFWCPPEITLVELYRSQMVRPRSRIT